MEETPKYKSLTVGELASKYGYSTPTFWDNFTPMHLHDMIALGYQLGKLKLKPRIVEYIVRVVVNQESREQFQELAGKSFH